jgi:hypothetical protein
MRRLAVATAAVVALLATAAALILLTAQFWMVRWLDSVLSQPGVVEGSHGAVRYSLWTGHLVVDNLSVTVLGPVPQSYGAAHLEAEGVGPRFLIDLARGKTVWQVDALRGQQLTAAGGPAHATIAALEIDGPAFAAGDAAGLPIFFLRRLHLSQGTLVDRKGAEGRFADARLTMDGALGEVTAWSAEIAELTLPAVTWAPLPATAASGQDQTLGPIRIDLDGTATFAASEKRLAAELHGRAPGGRDLTLSLRLSGVPTMLVAPQWTFLALALAPTRIERLEARYADGDWLATERTLEAVAASLGVPLRRDDAIAALEGQRAQIADATQAGDKDALLASLDALERFMRQGGTLTVNLAPPGPVTFGELALRRQRNAVALAEALGLQIR